MYNKSVFFTCKCSNTPHTHTHTHTTHTHTHTHTHTESDRSSPSFLWVIHNASGEMWVTSARSFMVRPFYGSLLFSRSVNSSPYFTAVFFRESRRWPTHKYIYKTLYLCHTHTPLSKISRLSSSRENGQAIDFLQTLGLVLPVIRWSALCPAPLCH